MSTSFAIIFIIGKAAIWLLLPLGFGIWEWRRHRRMMARGELKEGQSSIPAWLRAAPAQRPAPMRPQRPQPAPSPADREQDPAREPIAAHRKAA